MGAAVSVLLALIARIDFLSIKLHSSRSDSNRRLRATVGQNSSRRLEKYLKKLYLMGVKNLLKAFYLKLRQAYKKFIAYH